MVASRLAAGLALVLAAGLGVVGAGRSSAKPAPPPADPPLEWTPAMVVFCAVQVLVWAMLVYLRTQRTSAVDAAMVHTEHNAWMHTFIIIAWMALAYVAISDWCPQGLECPNVVHTTKLGVIWSYTPLIIFPLTVGEGLLLLTLQRQTHAANSVSWFMQFVIASTCSACLYYLLDESFGKCSVMSIFDRPLNPFHYCMWLTTMHTDLLTMHLLGQHIPKGNNRVRHNRCLYTGLINTQGLFVAAFLGNYLRLSLFWNTFLILVAFMCFGWVLSVCHELLGLVMERGGGGPNSKRQLGIVRVSIIVKWAIYTVVWALAALDLISVQVEESLITGVDVCKASLAICAWAMTR